MHTLGDVGYSRSIFRRLKIRRRGVLKAEEDLREVCRTGHLPYPSGSCDVRYDADFSGHNTLRTVARSWAGVYGLPRSPEISSLVRSFESMESA
jgi:hypothetical protein